MRRFWGICYSLVFYPLLIAYKILAVAGLGTLMLLGAPFESRRSHMRRFRRAISHYGIGVIRGLARPIMRTLYSAPPRNPQQVKIFVANHVSASDPFLISLFPEAMIQVVNLWPFRIPILGVFARWAGYLNIRAMSPEAFEKEGMRLLSEGISIAAFPEGTRSASRVLGPFHSALFRLAQTARVPIIPVCIVGNERTPAKGSWILEPATVQVRCLPEVPWESFQHLTTFQLKTSIRQLIQDEVTRMGEGT